MPVNKWSIGSVARGLAQRPREEQQAQQAANLRREEFAYDIMKMKYKFDQEAKQAQLTLQQPKTMTPDEIFKIKSKVEKLKLKYRDKEVAGTRYGRGRWMQEVEADGANLGKLLHLGESGNEEAQSLYDNIVAYGKTLPESLVDWMTITEQRNLSGTKVGTARATALASGFGNPQLPQQTGTRTLGGGCTLRREEPVYKGFPLPEGEDRRQIEGYREYKGYDKIGSGGKMSVPDLSGMAQKGSLMDTPQQPQQAEALDERIVALIEKSRAEGISDEIIANDLKEEGYNPAQYGL